MIPDLCGNIIRFRIGPIVVACDLEGAFLAVSLHPSQRDTVRFLFLKNPLKPPTEDNIQIFRYTSIIFGVISSPYILAAVIRYHLSKEGTSLASEIAKSCYADNLLLRASTPEEAILKAEEARSIFKKGGFNLREFMSNDAKVNEHFGAENMPFSQKFLGLQWDVDKDLILMKTRASEEDKKVMPTKRIVLSKIASIFDPVGFLAPSLFRAKLFFQSLFKLKNLGWDDLLPENLCSEWREILDHWSTEDFEITRLAIEPGKTRKHVSLFAFSDASKHGCAVCVYLRIEYEDSSVSSHYLFGKSRLNPISPITIPRLELSAAELAIRALTFVEQQMDIAIDAKFVGCDNMSVVSWVQSQSQKLPVFVKNRLKRIVEAKNCHFGHTKGAENPADLATRPADFSKPSQKQLWLHGPGWIFNPMAEIQKGFSPISEKFRKLPLFLRRILTFP